MTESQPEIPSLPFSLLGEFIIEFERICLLMRTGIINSLSIANERSKENVELLLLKKTAGPLLEMFVSVNKSSHNLTHREDAVLTSIAVEMRELIECRNNYLHGNWFRPNDRSEFATIEFIPGIRKTRSEGRLVENYMDLSAEAFRPKISRCNSLILSIAHFEIYRGKDEFDSHFPEEQNN